MGTVVTIDLYGDPDLIGELDEPVWRACASLHEADEVFSTWKPESPMSRLRRGEFGAGAGPFEIDEVLDACLAIRELTRGWFDPWAMRGGVDPTGYVKGWAAQRALGYLLDAPVYGALVNAAGDIAGFGSLVSGEPFRVGIADPRAPRELSALVSLRGCIATSGSYERGEHLMDPFTTEFVTRLASATVTGPDLGMADALATALVVAGPDLLEVIENLPEFDAFGIGFDGERRWTSQFPLIALAGESA